MKQDQRVSRASMEIQVLSEPQGLQAYREIRVVLVTLVRPEQLERREVWGRLERLALQVTQALRVRQVSLGPLERRGEQVTLVVPVQQVPQVVRVVLEIQAQLELLE